MIPAMNRQQRRMMEKQQARVRATRRPRPEHIPMLVKAQYTLEPLETLLDQIERCGTVDTAQGEAIFPNHADGVWYPAVGAVAGMADFFEMWATRHSKPLNVSALRQLAARLENGMPVDQPLADRLRTLFPVLRRVGATLDPHDAEDLIRQTLIKNELAAARATGAGEHEHEQRTARIAFVDREQPRRRRQRGERYRSGRPQAHHRRDPG